MRILKLTFVLCFLSSASFSQLDTKNQIDIVGNYLQNNVYRFSEIDGAGSADNGNGFCLGINYNRKVAEKLWVNSGINYLKTSNDYHFAIIDENPPPQVNVESELWRIPIKIRYDILKWFYLKTGLIVDYQFNNQSGKYIDNQSGIGYSLSAGINLNLSELIYFNIEPELGFTSLIPFNSDRYQQHFLISGVNFNIGLRF